MNTVQPVINASDVSEYEPHKFSAFASDLQWQPGYWPRVIATSLGNGQPFVGKSKRVVDGDLQWADYQQGNGCLSLRIYND